MNSAVFDLSQIFFQFGGLHAGKGLKIMKKMCLVVIAAIERRIEGSLPMQHEPHHGRPHPPHTRKLFHTQPYFLSETPLQLPLANERLADYLGDAQISFALHQ